MSLIRNRQKYLNRIRKQFSNSTKIIDTLESITQSSLPDPNDNPVLLAAIKRQVHYIVTENTKDFPQKNLKVEGLIRCYKRLMPIV